MSSAYISVTEGIFLVDAHYFRNGMTACYIVSGKEEVAIVDTGTAPTPDLLSKALDEIGVSPEQVTKLVVTHAHLDHCAATAELLKRFQNAVAVAHENAAPHILDPFDKLWDSAVTLWGESFCREHYNCVDKVDPAKLMQVSDGDEIKFGAGNLRVIYTPGHAWHHMSALDEKTGTLFAGDSFGVSYREFDGNNGLGLMIPTSPPNQFKPEVMKDSIRRMLAVEPERVCVTHFGVVADPQAAGERLIECIDQSLEIARDVCAAEPLDKRQEALASNLQALYVKLAKASGAAVGTDCALEMLDFDATLSSKGILHYLDREEQKAART